MSRLTELIEEDNGRLSSMRLIFIIGTIWNMVITSIFLMAGHSATEAIVFFSAVEGVFAGTKLAQKPMEKGKKDAPDK